MHGNYKFSLGTVAVILNIITATSCSAERPFSLLGKLEIYPGSIMEENCLSHLALLRIERAYSNRVDTEKVIHQFESRKGRFEFFFQSMFIYFQFCEKSGY